MPRDKCRARNCCAIRSTPLRRRRRQFVLGAVAAAPAQISHLSTRAAIIAGASSTSQRRPRAFESVGCQPDYTMQRRDAVLCNRLGFGDNKCAEADADADDTCAIISVLLAGSTQRATTTSLQSSRQSDNARAKLISRRSRRSRHSRSQDAARAACCSSAPELSDERDASASSDRSRAGVTRPRLRRPGRSNREADFAKLQPVPRAARTSLKRASL